MHGRESSSDVAADARGLVRFESAARRERLPQVAPLDELERDQQASLARRRGPHRHDVGMLDAREGACLAQEGALRCLVVPTGVHDLERDAPTEREVLRVVDRRVHSAAEQAERAEAGLNQLLELDACLGSRLWGRTRSAEQSRESLKRVALLRRERLEFLRGELRLSAQDLLDQSVARFRIRGHVRQVDTCRRGARCAHFAGRVVAHCAVRTRSCECSPPKN